MHDAYGPVSCKILSKLAHRSYETTTEKIAAIWTFAVSHFAILLLPAWYGAD